MAVTNRKINAVGDLIRDLTCERANHSAASKEETGTERAIDHASTSVAYPMIFDKEPAFISCPVEEIDSLRRRFDPISLPRALLERPPVACGMIRTIQLLGIFPTTRWLTDPTMHPDVKELFGGTPFLALGDYRVALIDLLDSSGTTHALILVLNKGVEGMLTGHWGAIFERSYPHICWARLEATGENETSVKSEPHGDATYQEFRCIDFCEHYFEAGVVSWICTTQLEKIFGLTAEFLLALQWTDLLPMDLIETCDKSCRLERKRRARIARQRESRRGTPDENSLPEPPKGKISEKPLADPTMLLFPTPFHRFQANLSAHAS